MITNSTACAHDLAAVVWGGHHSRFIPSADIHCGLVRAGPRPRAGCSVNGRCTRSLRKHRPRHRAQPAGGVTRAFSAIVAMAASLLTCSQVSGVCAGSWAGPAGGQLGPRFRLGQGGDAGRRPGLGSPQSQAVGGSGTDRCRGHGLGSGRHTGCLNPAVPLAGRLFPMNGRKWVRPSLT